MRLRYSVARWAGVHLVRFLIAIRSLRTGEHLAVRLKRQPVLNGPLVEQRWIIRELQQRRSNLLRFRHAFMHRIKASFLVCTSGIGQVSQPPDISIAHMESRCADIQDITITNSRRAGERNDAAQIGFRAIFRSMGSTPSELSSKRLPALTATPARSKMWRPCSKALLCCCCGAAISLTNGLRRRPANANLHAIRARTAVTTRFAGAIQIPPWQKWTAASVAFTPMLTKSYAASRGGVGSGQRTVSRPRWDEPSRLRSARA